MAEGRSIEIAESYPEEFLSGFGWAMVDEVGYPIRFHEWPAHLKDAWIAGYDTGYRERIWCDEAIADCAGDADVIEAYQNWLRKATILKDLAT